MIKNEPESANRWATEHYGFEDHVADREGRSADADPSSPRPPSPRHDPPRSRRRSTLIASTVLSVALVAGIGGAAVASDHGPVGGHDGIIHGVRGDHGGRGGNR